MKILMFSGTYSGVVERRGDDDMIRDTIENKKVTSICKFQKKIIRFRKIVN